MPPRVPSGRPSTCASCERSPGTRYTVRSSPIDGSPIASRLTRGGRGHVSLDERGRDAEHVGDVVEPGRGVVWRQQRADIDVEREQIANGVRVFGAVQTMQRGRAGIESPRRRSIERGFERRGERLARRGRRLRRVLGRHHPGAQLADDLLPDLGVAIDGGGAQRVERQAAGLRARVVTGHAVLLQERVRC